MSETKKPATPRIPLEVNEIQVNFCKDPVCSNYGRPASQEDQRKGKKKGAAGALEKDTYTIEASGKDAPVLKCRLCKDTPPIKSNLGIAEELERISKPLKMPTLDSACPKEGCENSRYSALYSNLYARIGETSAGNPRYRCRKCGTRFAVRLPRSSIERQRSLRRKNFEIFKDLVHKMPFSGISNKHGISMERVYAKIAFFREQCVAFAAHRERHFKDMQFDTRYIAVDRQAYRMNWFRKEDRRNVILLGVASADMDSGYIFGHHLDYDSTVDADEINDDAVAIGDLHLKPPYRRYARYHLRGETSAPRKGIPKEIGDEDPPIAKNIKQTYANAVVRGDIEAPDEEFLSGKLPPKGMRIHSEYTLYAHFLYLKDMLQKAEHLVFYMDQESAIRAACHAAFWEDILAKRVEGFFVQIDKTLTIDKKRQLVAKVRRERDDYVAENPVLEGADIESIRQLRIEQMLDHRTPIGPWKDEWLFYPFPDMSEPSKAVSWMTDLGDGAYSNFELAKLFLKASLHSVDRYFMQLRRKLSLLERPYVSASSGRRTWNAYDPYNPKVVEMLLDIYRVYYNYVKVGYDKQTPAMRLGIAKSPIQLQKILYFVEYPNNLIREIATRSSTRT